MGEKAVFAEYLDLASRASAYVTGQMGEKAVLAEYLDRYRMTFELKCEGLTAEQGSQLKGVRDAGAPWLDL